MADPERVQAFIVGAQRCGTTSVATALGRHPQVALAEPLRPEPKFFLEPGAVGEVACYLDRYFPERGDHLRVRVEKSTSYLGSDRACTQIAEAFPAARIVVVVRDPVARAASHYAFSRAHGHEDLDPDAALRQEAEDRPWDAAAVSESPFAYLTRGRYIDHLARWDEAFGSNRVRVVVLEDLVAEPEGFEGLEAFLGVEPAVRFDPTERHNEVDDRIELSDAVRTRLRAYFAEPNAALARRLGRPLDRWSHA
jgi:Sulfotransferase domain